MANNPQDRTILNPLERPLADDLNQAQSQLDRTIRSMAYAESLRRTSSAGDGHFGVVNEGFINDGFRVYPFAGMQVAVNAGIGFKWDPTDVPGAIDGIVGLSDLSPYKPMQLVLPALFTVPAAPGPGLSRFDIIEAKVYRRRENPLSRDVLDPATGAFTPSLINKTLAFTHDGQTGTVVSPAVSAAALSYKVGIAGAPGAVPATTAGYTRLAIIYVPTGTVAMTEGTIRDTRKLVSPGGSVTVGAMWDFKNGALPPANVTFVAPPGVRCAVVHPAAFNHVIELYFFLEGVRAGAMSLNQTTFGALTPVLGDSSLSVAHNPTPADIANLANVAVSTPALIAFADFAVAPQECVSATIGYMEWDVASQLWVALAHDVSQMQATITLLL